MEAAGLIQTYRFGANTVSMARCLTAMDIRRFIGDSLSEKHLPDSRKALILIKPNLNNDLNALTGNSTDLRIMTILIECLKDRGYANIVVGDGHNVGVDRRGINVFRRLRVDTLCQRYGIRFLNLNRDESREVSIGNQRIRIARTALEADFFVNLPKIKTHAEAMVSLSLKNMIGCVVGQDKRKIHRSLAENIVRLNGILKPHIHIVDGLIAMEGNGPGDGHPVRLDLLVSGSDPFVTDLLCARLIGIDWKEIGALSIAKQKGLFEDRDLHEIGRVLPIYRRLKKPPPRHILTRVADLRALYPLKRLMRPITSLRLAAAAAYGLHIIQDVYDLTDDDNIKVIRNRDRCRDCSMCAEYCPMGIDIEKIGAIPASPECIQCLYCYFVCPEKAIRMEGSPGFLSRIVDRYADDIQRAVSDKPYNPCNMALS